MVTISEIYKKMTLTGFIIFLLGLVTLSPEIYFSGLIVMALSMTVELKEFEKQGLESQHTQSLNEQDATNYYASW